MNKHPQRKPAFVLFLLAACSLQPLLGQPNRTITAFQAEKRFQEGRTLFEQGDYRGAIPRFNEVVELDPNHTRVYEMRGESFYQTGDYSRALSDYQAAYNQYPNNVELVNSMGVCAAKLKLYDAAASYFYEALKIDPNHQAARENLDRVQAILREQKLPIAQATPQQPSYNPSFPNPNPNPGPNPVPGQQQSVTRGDRNYGRERIQVGKQSDVFLTIEQVKILPSGTQVTFVMENATKESYPFALDRTGGPNALYLTDRGMTRVYALRNVRGLRSWPSQPYVLLPGEKITFVGEFDKLDDTLTYFHLLEGRQARPGAWEFWDVRLID
jgi:tetratricopeptide (TPR) repeat protein